MAKTDHIPEMRASRRIGLQLLPVAVAYALALPGCASTAAEREAAMAEAEAVFDFVEIEGPDGSPTTFAVYVPDGDTPEAGWPLVVFLHGSGESGTDPTRPLRTGIAPSIKANPERFPGIVVFPQSPRATFWQLEVADAVEAYALATWNIDRERVYVTGLSMGGFGAWRMAIVAPDRYAAVLPICGGGNAGDAHVLTHMPIWAFHSIDDPVVPEQASRWMVDAVREAGGNPKYTVYPDAEHDSWTRTYNNPEVIAWLFDQRRDAQ